MSEFTKTLRELADQNVSLIRDIEDAGGELDERLELLVDDISTKLAQKVDRYAGLLSDLEDSLDKTKRLIKELQAQAKNKEHTINRLEGSVKSAMLTMNVDKLEGDVSSFQMGTAGGVAKLNIDEDLLPKEEQYWIKEVVMKPDKEGIRRDLTDGEVIPGASLTRSYTLKRKVVNKLKEPNSTTCPNCGDPIYKGKAHNCRL